MKRFALLLIMLCASGIVSMAQDYSYEANPKKFDLSIGGQLFSADFGDDHPGISAITTHLS